MGIEQLKPIIKNESINNFNKIESSVRQIHSEKKINTFSPKIEDKNRFESLNEIIPILNRAKIDEKFEFIQMPEKAELQQLAEKAYEIEIIRNRFTSKWCIQRCRPEAGGSKSRIRNRYVNDIFIHSHPDIVEEDGKKSYGSHKPSDIDKQGFAYESDHQFILTKLGLTKWGRRQQAKLIKFNKITQADYAPEIKTLEELILSTRNKKVIVPALITLAMSKTYNSRTKDAIRHAFAQNINITINARKYLESILKKQDNRDIKGNF